MSETCSAIATELNRYYGKAGYEFAEYMIYYYVV